MARLSAQQRPNTSIWNTLRSSRLRIAATAASFSLLPAALAACGQDEPAKFTTAELKATLKDQYEKQDVRRCLGTAVVRYDGNVRSQPFIGDDRQETVIPFFKRLLPENQLVLHEPHRIGIATSEASSTWYTQRYNDGRLAFINQDALVDSNLYCGEIASPNDEPGLIEVR